MALLDDLVSQVPDLPLRSSLQKAIDVLRRKQRFGLVFDEHIPETTAISRLPIQVGALVQRREDTEGKARFRVRRLIDNGETAVIVRDDDQESTAKVDDLLVIKRFGEPVYVALKPVECLKRGPNERPYHAVIKGENFHALQLLTYMYEKSVDCIYIDPPYNTGARDWKYNNRFVDSNDGWRHSKWLAMMEKRLRLAKRLLKPDGVLIVMIDEHEIHHLGMLLARIFPEYIRYAVSIVINARGSTGNRNFGSIEEQAIFVVPDLGYDVIQPREGFISGLRVKDEGSDTSEQLLTKIFQVYPDLADQMLSTGASLEQDQLDYWNDLSLSELAQPEDDLETEFDDDNKIKEVPKEDNSAIYWRGAVRTGQGTSFRVQRKNQFYPLLFDPEKIDRIEVGEPLLGSEDGMLPTPSWDKVDGLTPIWPVDEEGAERVWCYEPGRMRDEIARGNIRIGRFNPKRNSMQ